MLKFFIITFFLFVCLLYTLTASHDIFSLLEKSSERRLDNVLVRSDTLRRRRVARQPIFIPPIQKFRNKITRLMNKVKKPVLKQLLIDYLSKISDDRGPTLTDQQRKIRIIVDGLLGDQIKQGVRNNMLQELIRLLRESGVTTKPPIKPF
jgi:hypothetical protein